MSNGATIWSRNTIDSDVFFYKPDKWFKIWFYLVSEVNHKDNKLFKRGEGLITYENIMDKTKATREQTRKCLKWMEREHMIEHRRTTRGMIRRILNYEKYQNLKNYKNTERMNERTLAEHLETSPINKNDKNDKNDKNNHNTYSSLNSLTNEYCQLIADHYQLPVATVLDLREELKLYCAAKGKRYSNYGAALQNWIRRRIREGEYARGVN